MPHRTSVDVGDRDDAPDYWAQPAARIPPRPYDDGRTVARQNNRQRSSQRSASSRPDRRDRDIGQADRRSRGTSRRPRYDEDSESLYDAREKYYPFGGRSQDERGGTSSSEDRRRQGRGDNRYESGRPRSRRSDVRPRSVEAAKSRARSRDVSMPSQRRSHYNSPPPAEAGRFRTREGRRRSPSSPSRHARPSARTHSEAPSSAKPRRPTFDRKRSRSEAPRASKDRDAQRSFSRRGVLTPFRPLDETALREEPPDHNRDPHSKTAMLGDAARCAAEAGAMMALRVRHEPGPWMGPKGAKVASAALAGAVVDTFMDRKHPKKKGGMRHMALRSLAQAALGNVVVQPGLKMADAKMGIAHGSMQEKKGGLLRSLSERFVRP